MSTSLHHNNQPEQNCKFDYLYHFHRLLKEDPERFIASINKTRRQKKIFWRQTYNHKVQALHSEPVFSIKYSFKSILIQFETHWIKIVILEKNMLAMIKFKINSARHMSGFKSSKSRRLSDNVFMNQNESYQNKDEK